MTSHRLHRFLLTLVLAVGVCAPACAATPGVNVYGVSAAGDPYVRTGSDASAAWADINASGAKTLRAFVAWNDLVGAPAGNELNRWSHFVHSANTRGMNVLLVVTGTPSTMAAPADYARAVAALATRLKGTHTAFEVWNEPDDTVFWRNGPQPAAYTALLKAAYPAIKGADPSARVLVGGLVGNDADFVADLYANGARGSFDAVSVHTDTACNTTDPREYYREPDGRIGRYSFTGYREIHKVMLGHDDDKPIWMSELGWSTTNATCTVGAWAGTRPGGVSREQQADFLAKAYGCLAADPYVEQALWFSLHDVDTSGAAYDRQLGLITDAFSRKPAFAAFTHAAAAQPMACGGTLDGAAPAVSFVRPAPGTQYYSSLPIQIHAEDDQGIQDINLLVDGQDVPVRTVKGRSSDVSIVYYGAAKLGFGSHTLVARARDEAGNVGSAETTIVRLGGAGEAARIPSMLQVSYGTVRRRAMVVKGSVSFPNGVRGEGQVEFRFERRVRGGWKLKNLWHRTAHRPFSFRFAFRQGGRWRVRARYVPAGPYRSAAVAARRLVVR